MSTNRHPAGTSLGGQWAPGAAAEVDDSPIEDDNAQLDRSMSSARRVLAGGETGSDLNPAIGKLMADEDYTSTDTLTRYAGVRSIADAQITAGLNDQRISTTDRALASEVFDDDSRPITAGEIRGSRKSGSQVFGVSHNHDGSYRVRLLHEEDVHTEVTTGDRTAMDNIRVNTLLTDRVEATGDTKADTEAIRGAITALSEHEEASPRVVDSFAHDFAAEGRDEVVADRDITYDEEAPATYDVEQEVLEK